MKTASIVRGCLQHPISVIAIYRPPDVRLIPKAFHGKDIPVEDAKQEHDVLNVDVVSMCLLP